MRRTDRQVTDPLEIRDILSRNQVCTLSMSVNGEPYGVVLNYGFEMDGEDRLTLYFHSAAQGRKLDMMRENPRVAFSVFGAAEVVPGEIPCEYTELYESVAGVGTIRFEEDASSMCRALDVLMQNHGMEGAGAYKEEMLKRISVFRLEVESYSAKRNRRG